MKILTLNTWQEREPWRRRWEVLLKEFPVHDADVVAFQEVFNHEWAKEVQKKTGYPFLVFPEEPSGLMILSRFPVGRWECLTMKTKSPTENYLRYALFAELHAPGGALMFFNTHLSWKLDEGTVREKQIDEILNFIDRTAGHHDTVIVGDFNAPPQTPEIAKMSKIGLFTDAFSKVHPVEPGLTWDNRNPYAHGSSSLMPDRRIDYIWVRNAGNVLGQVHSVSLAFTRPASDGVFASDHFGVVAQFII